MSEVIPISDTNTLTSIPNHTNSTPMPVSKFSIIPIRISGFCFIPILIFGFLSYRYPKFIPIPIPVTDIFFWYPYLVSVLESGMGRTIVIRHIYIFRGVHMQNCILYY